MKATAKRRFPQGFFAEALPEERHGRAPDERRSGRRSRPSPRQKRAAALRRARETTTVSSQGDDQHHRADDPSGAFACRVRSRSG